MVQTQAQRIRMPNVRQTTQNLRESKPTAA
nr:MAG TPA: hypothetical protein [Caudoviricetes sp.]